MFLIGLAIAVLGIVAVITSGIITNRSIRGSFGGVDQFTIKASEGTGVVPRWVSTLNLGGWLAVVVGVIVGFVMVVV